MRAINIYNKCYKPDRFRNEVTRKSRDNLIDISTRKDLEAVSKIVLDDILLSVDAQVYKGKAGYMGVAETFWHKKLPDGHFTSKNEKVEVSEDGTLGYVFGEHSFLKAEDNSVFEHVHHLYVWRKHKGIWKMAAIHISHPQKE